MSRGQRRGAAGALHVLLTPRWLLGHLLVASLVGLFITLGLWQMQRLDERVARNELITRRLEAPAAPVTELLEGTDDVGELAYRSASAQGRFDPENEVLLRSRSRDGQAGWHVLTPLLLEDGRALLVDRGWVPYPLDTPPVEQALPPSVEVRVEGRLREEQDPPSGPAAALAPRDPAEGRLRASYYVDVDRLAGQMPYELLPVYLEVVDQVPPQARELPLAPLAPDLDTGPHRAYALQWFSFAAIGIVGYALLLRRTVRDDREAHS